MFNLNLYLWKYILPAIKQDFFKSKIISFFTLFYISIFSLPRKFLIHFFFGKGSDYIIDTEKMILENPLVYQKLNSALNDNFKNETKGVVHFSQIDLYNPQYRYSIGSFEVNYSIENNNIDFQVTSIYRYGRNNDRLSKHLHNWLNGFAKSGGANDFRIVGTEWSIHLLEFRQKNIQFDNGFIKKGGPTLGKLLL
ncbi:MAG: hypothetical protein HND52_19305 [Ignavibacteriae bacterium]|nr:hypothetical protein [Ignavibacteriota bacterium]NOH00114.1 hypothetical protein [Ignavibacteriota bacterium]